MATETLTTSEKRKLAVLMRMALMYADAGGAEPDAARRARAPRSVHGLLRQAHLLRRYPGVASRA
jgi:hypothetical protein